MNRGTTEPTEDAPERRTTPEFWLAWVKAAKKGARAHWDDAKDAWDEFKNQASETAQIAGEISRTTGSRKYPAYWSACKTIQPAYYARTPTVTTRRLFDIDDPIAATSCLIVERLAKHLIENCNFDEVMQSAVQDFIHADKATAQVIYEADIKEGTERKPIEARQMEDGSVVPYDGERPYAGEAEILSDENGHYYESPYKRAENKKIRVAKARYNRILHTPEATCEDEITERAYYFCVDYDEALRKFPDIKLANVPWKTSRAYKEDGEAEQHDSNDKPGKYLEGWECWCSRTKKVYFVCEGYNEGFLKEPIDDPYKLRKFYPSPPFVISNRPDDSLYPTPDWIQLKPTADLLHKCYARIMQMVDAARRRALVDEASEEVIQALEELDSGEFVTAKNLGAIVEKGGLSNLIQYLPVEELVKAISELVQLEERFDAKFAQWKGVPDILQGISDAVETARAQEIKTGAAHDRFKFDKYEIQRLARDLIEQMVDIALQVYEPDEIAEITGLQYMQPQDQDNFPQAVQDLKSDWARLLRVEIETDSTSFVDEEIEQNKRQKVGELLIGGLDKIAAIAQTTPDFVPVALRVLLYGISGLQGGKDFEDDVIAAVNQLVQKAQQPPPGPPPPDPIEQMKAQVAMEEIRLKQQQIGVEMQKVAQKGQESQVDAALKAQEQRFDEWLQAQKLEVERMKIALAEREKLIEERRLAEDTRLEVMKAQAAQAAPPKAVTINLGGGSSKPKSAEPDQPERPKRKRITPIRDADGNAVSYDYEELGDA